MKTKYILEKEDIEDLTFEYRVFFTDFYENASQYGVVYSSQLKKYVEYLKDLYDSGVLSSGNNKDEFLVVLERNLRSILDIILNLRNKVIKGDVYFRHYDFVNMKEGLRNIRFYILSIVNDPKYKDSIGIDELDDLADSLFEIEDQIMSDSKYYLSYLKEKRNAVETYINKKRLYESLGTYGKIASYFNGAKKELSKAKELNSYFTTNNSILHFNGEILNPLSYEKYVKDQMVKNKEMVLVK